ncbi:universal stress protein [Hymenobacter lucidus]|uniref:Universal stress protein n=1 Tax=Hymenobacter lucidus TaxID=2880930 RepID=A0ABS8ALB8_9BACT|nr:universal stress protein [Hymenobacter lucidus]MCB2407010.1 universal stress protein [Hymenobacter lucidus]
MAAALLILTDFFQAANRALNYASNLAGAIGGRMVLLHVRRDSVLDPEMFTGQLSCRSQEAADIALHSVAGNLAVPVVAEVGYGQVAYAVADAVSRHHPALIVLGRPDYSSLPDELVHTTSLDILRTAPYPMLVVPHTLASTQPPRRLLLAVDGEAFSLGEHAGAARHLLAALGAALTVLHVATTPSETEVDPAAWSVLQTGLAVDLPTQVHTRTVVDESPVEGILQAARPEDFDLVVLIARPRSFLGQLFHHSVTAQVLLHSPIPVLVLPATE